MAWTREPGSFKDPAGFVFSCDGVLYRQVNEHAGELYRRLVDSGLYADLARDGLLVEHEEVALRMPDAPPAFTVLKPQRIPFVSYPYEWCFSQLKAAALLTLEVQKRALAHGLVLRDASAYNVQFVGTTPIFIDTLSFGEYVEGEPWVAYRQFCQHFLAPLALMALADPSLRELLQVHLDGLPLELARNLLPLRSRLRPGLLLHLHLHGRSGPRDAGPRVQANSTRRGMGKKAMLGLVESLERTIDGLDWRPAETLWSSYPEQSNYSVAAQDHKRRLVAEWLATQAAHASPRAIWDLGANTGEYSRLAAEHASVVSFDSDEVVVERHFNAARSGHGLDVLPVVQNLLNPSPAVGWAHQERQSLVARGPADGALALALLHHLVISGNVPLCSVARFFSEMCRWLIIEFVPKEDSQVQRMLALREDVFVDYTQDGFERAFEPHFATLRSASIDGTARRLYLMGTR